MSFLKLFIVIFISLTTSIKAESDTKIINQLAEGGNFIFIRHAYAPGSGDPINFNLNDCSSQRNLNEEGKLQAKEIGNFFKKNNINIEKIYSSEWCRCIETANIAFGEFTTKTFLNSFYSPKFQKNKKQQMIKLKKYVKKFRGDKNLIFVTHYVVISEALNYSSSSGEIVVFDKKFNIIGNIIVNH